ncbi:MAG TPA: hypothetical protein GXZ74_07655 [Tissierellia bacterium]|nr:hypothetical protein [Tissierellia bacterium]
MGRIIFYIIILLIQFLFRVLKPIVGRSRPFQDANRRIHALKSDLRKPKNR